MKKSTIILSVVFTITLFSITILLYSRRLNTSREPQKEKVEAWLTSCIADKEAHSQGFFNPGDLMIMFSPELDILTAQNILLTHNLITPEQFLPQWPWPHAAPGALMINVPAQEEFKWMCILEKETNILSVTLNHIAKITTQ